MDWVSLLITYVVCWWLLLFMVLPFCVDFTDKKPDVAYAAAPAQANLKKKILITTLLAIPLAILVQWGFDAAVVEIVP
jgi:predicted secreted protein